MQGKRKRRGKTQTSSTGAVVPQYTPSKNVIAEVSSKYQCPLSAQYAILLYGEVDAVHAVEQGGRGGGVRRESSERGSRRATRLAYVEKRKQSKYGY